VTWVARIGAGSVAVAAGTRVLARMSWRAGCATIVVVGPTVLIVDDHGRFRVAARLLLESVGFDVVGEAADGDEALAAVAALHPAIVLLDIQLPGRDGFEVAERLAADPGSTVVILISSRDAVAYGDRVGRAPVAGFIAKNALSAEAIYRLVG
jgi:DNA-binding NarL/FixJ family response regulator